MTLDLQSIAVIGGTGTLGSGLARRWTRAGLSVIIGSRDAAKAVEFAKSLPQQATGRPAGGFANSEAAARAEIIVLAVPFASQMAMIEEIRPQLAGKILLDTTVPLVPPRVARVQLPAEGSAALRAQAAAGSDVRVISGFHNVAAHKLGRDEPIDCDILIFGDDPAARETGIVLARKAGLRGIHGGPLANSAAAEALTSVLISINKRYGVDGAGLAITGIGQEEI
jgi:NADPH-dependent F420 reductase